jgi:hypothetical protein
VMPALGDDARSETRARAFSDRYLASLCSIISSRQHSRAYSAFGSKRCFACASAPCVLAFDPGATCTVKH